MKRQRVYLDTSIIGGCLEKEFTEDSNAVISMAREGALTLLVSSLLLQELRRAPVEVQEIVASLPNECVEKVAFADAASALRDAYLAAEVVGPASAADAHHVALATIARADMILSWNFKHIVHYDKMRGFNAVNLREGYPTLEIHSPLEVA